MKFVIGMKRSDSLWRFCLWRCFFIFRPNLVFATTSDIPQLMLLLLREPARLQKVLLPGLVSITIFTTGRQSAKQPGTRPSPWRRLSAGRSRRGQDLQRVCRPWSGQLVIRWNAWGPSFLIAYFCRLFFDLNNKESSSLGNKEKSLFLILVGPQISTTWIPYFMGTGRTQGMMRESKKAPNVSPAQLAVGGEAIRDGGAFKFWTLGGGGTTSSPEMTDEESEKKSEDDQKLWWKRGAMSILLREDLLNQKRSFFNIIQRGGGGVNGFLNNVKENCTVGGRGLP